MFNITNCVDVFDCWRAGVITSLYEWLQVCMNGRNIFMGYLNMKEKTLETLDADLWLKSGDVGKKDEDGFLYITGRIKGN